MQTHTTALQAPPRGRRIPAPLVAPALAPVTPDSRLAQGGALGTHDCTCGGICPRCNSQNRTSAVRVIQERSGDQLPDAARAPLERRFGEDLSHVRLHRGAAALAATCEVGARRAFATGSQIVIGDPRFNLGTTDGVKLLAHEVVHVLQQRGAGYASPRADDPSRLENEARTVAALFTADPVRPFPRIRPAAGIKNRVQCDEPAPPASALPGLLGEQSRLELDPELEAMAARLFFQQWLAAQIGVQASPAPAGGTSPATSPTAQGSAAGGTHDANTAQGGTVAAQSLGQAVPLPRKWFVPSLIGAETLDFGKLSVPYFDRGILPNTFGDTRDIEMMGQLFADRYRLVSTLPDLRAIAPDFARKWIPVEWRTRLAQTLTATTIDFALSHDHPTVIDLSNQAWERVTGATTYSLPMVPVPRVSDWWDRISGGGGRRSR